jgi:cobalt-zinc-cadmium efflux system outer membrane protein
VNPTAEFRAENFFSGVSRTQLPLDVFAEVTQVLELGGKRAARRRLVESGRATEEALQSLVWLSVQRQVISDYLDALRHRERTATHEAQRTDLTEAVRVLDRRVTAGVTAEAELLRMRTELARARRALALLNARTGAEASLEALSIPTLPALPDAAPDEALARRADVLAARQSVDTARRALRFEDARGIPDPAVNAGYKRTAGQNTALMTFTLPLPLFNRNQTSRTLALGAVTSAQQELAATERRARGELSASRLVAERLRAHARELQATLVAPALAARDAARAAFASGALDVMRLVDAERVYTDARLVTLDVDIDALAAAIEARLSAGEDPLP